jgi:hypothetical protein
MPRVPGSGRKPGTKNALPPMGKGFREVLRNLIGIDDESVVRLKRIDKRAVSARERLWQTLHGVRPASTQEFLAVLKFCADYGIGTPVRMTGDVVQRPPLQFVSQTGYLPYDSRHPSNKEIDARSREMNIANDKQLALEAAQRAAPVVPEPESEPELEIVPEPPR